MLKKIGNKGFAITGILYTLLILFLLIMLSVLAGLSSRKNMLESSNELLEQSFLGKKVNTTENINSVKNGIAPVTGKYVFELDDGSTKIKCSTYLNKGDSMSITGLNNKFVPKDCNDYSYTIVYGTENPTGIKMIFKDIYSFEKE